MLSIDNDGILSVRVNLPDHLEVDIKAEIKWKDRGPAPVAPIGKGGSGSGGTAVKTWEEECEFTTMIAGIILREGEEGLSKQDYSRIKDLMDRLDQARKSGNKSSAVALKPQLEEENNGFFFFIVLVLGRMMAQDPTTTTKVGLTKANQLADAVTEADRYKQQRNYPAMLKVIKDRIEPIVLSDDLLGNNTGAGGGINLAGLLKQ